MTGIDSGQTGIIVNLAGSERGFTFTNIQSSVRPTDVLQAAIVYRWKYVTILEVAMTSS